VKRFGDADRCYSIAPAHDTLKDAIALFTGVVRNSTGGHVIYQADDSSLDLKRVYVEAMADASATLPDFEADGETYDVFQVLEIETSSLYEGQGNRMKLCKNINIINT